MKNFFKKVPPRVLAFALILSALLMGAEAVLASAENRCWVEMEDARAYPSSYDVCILGPSTAMENNANQELFERYGIAAISLADMLQPMYISRYALEEFLNYQSPKVVLLDTSPLFYTEEVVEKWTRENEKSVVTRFLNGIRSPSARWKLFREILRYDDDVKAWSLLSGLNYTHENWKNPGGFFAERPFDPYSAHGNIYLMDVSEKPYEHIYEKSDPAEEEPISESAERYLSEIVQLCGEAGTELILLTEKLNFTKGQNNTLLRLADQYGLDYLNINEHVEEIGVQYDRDLYDRTHFNLSGAVKISDWLGRRLSERYEFTDKRTLPGYERYWDHSEAFSEKKEYMNGALFYEYLQELAELDLEENAVFISAYDDAAEKLGDSGVQGLRSLGLEADLKGNPGCCYAAVLHGTEVREEFDPVNPVILSGAVEGVPYIVMSGGPLNKDQSRISMDNVDYMQKGRGLNFVVYNLPSKRVTDSVFFDTHAFGNPHVETYTDEYGPSMAEGTLQRYLANLMALDKERYAVFLSVQDDASSKLGVVDRMLLRELGLKSDLRGRYRCSYAAVLHGAEVREELSMDHPVTLKGTVGETPYTVISGGLSGGMDASIDLGGIDYVQGGRGFNFVVYDADSGQVADSVFFDTNAQENPLGETRTTEFRESARDLAEEGAFRGYLMKLAELDRTRYAVFLSVQDEAATSLRDTDAALLSGLGLKTDLRGQYRCSYAAVLHGAEVREKFSKENLVTLAGTVGDQFYMVTSGGLASGGEAHIVVGGTDYIQHGRGFNFVVYDAVSGEVAESVFFDTYAQENPLGETRTTEFKEGLQALIGETGDFRNYLMELAELDQTRYAVFLSVQDEATAALNSIDTALLERLGLRTNLRGQYRCSYAAVLHDGEAREGFSLEKPVTLTGMVGGLPYKVTSGGLASGVKAGIELNGKEYIQGGRGFNVVVCDLETGEVEESVYFDTYGAVNPHKETMAGAGGS